jgi:hypothetical protein
VLASMACCTVAQLVLSTGFIVMLSGYQHILCMALCRPGCHCCTCAVSVLVHVVAVLVHELLRVMWPLCGCSL